MPTTNNDIYYETHGDHNNPCIMLIAGLGNQLVCWPDTFINELVTAGFYIVAFDNRDSGYSKHYHDAPAPEVIKIISAIKNGEKITPPYLLIDMANDVINLMDELNIKQAHMLGISMGGMIAQLLAINFPTRTLSLICIATTSNEPGLPDAKTEVMQMFFAKPKENTLENYVADKVALYKIYNHPNYFNHEEAAALHTKVYQRDSNNRDGFKRQLFAIIATPPRTERLKQTKIPSLIIHGDYDPAFPLEHGKQLAEIIPNSKLSIIPLMGHGIPSGLVKPITSEIIKFVAGINQ
jgi:pimeloyl-ACP methyl ester carboxylesterase